MSAMFSVALLSPNVYAAPAADALVSRYLATGAFHDTDPAQETPDRRGRPRRPVDRGAARGPSLIDLNARKAEVIAAVKKATGRDLVIDGPVSLRLLPIPTATVTGVKFFNVAGAKNPNMVEVKSVTVRFSLLALLVGNIDVSEVTLVEPKIVLEINAEGKPNWEFAPSVAEAKPAAPRAQHAVAAVARPARHRERHADLQRLPARSLRRCREGKFQRLGRLDRRTLFVGR